METLLKTHLGFPVNDPYTLSSTRLHITTTSSKSILEGCYWIRQPPSVVLSPTPVASSMQSSKQNPLQLWIPHPSAPHVIGVPKFYGLSAYGIPQKDLRTTGNPIATHWNSAFTLRKEQEQGVHQTLATLQQWGGAFFQADCGFGKSVCIAALIHKLQRKCIVVLPRLTLIEQMSYDLGTPHVSRASILQGASIGILQGSYEKCKDDLEKDIILASLDSLALFQYPSSFWKTVGLVIFDEAHHMAARTLSSILPHIPSRYIVGMSATPDRSDGLEHVLYWLLGPVSFVYKRLPSITGISGTVHVRRIKGIPIEDSFTAWGKLNFADMLTTLASNTNRNMLIITQFRTLQQTRAKILVITAFRDHAELLSSKLEIGLIHGSRSEQGPSHFVATYGMLEEGFDDASIDTLILCTPRSRVQQTIGRAERTQEGKRIPLVIDIVDSHSIFESMWWKRHKFYKSRGFTIESSVKESDKEPMELDCVIDDC